MTGDFFMYTVLMGNTGIIGDAECMNKNMTAASQRKSAEDTRLEINYIRPALPAGSQREIRSYIPVQHDYSTHDEPGNVFIYRILVMPSVAIFSDFPFNYAF